MGDGGPGRIAGGLVGGERIADFRGMLACSVAGAFVLVDAGGDTGSGASVGDGVGDVGLTMFQLLVFVSLSG